MDLQKLFDTEKIDKDTFETLRSEIDTLNSKVSEARDDAAKRRLKNNELSDTMDQLKAELDSKKNSGNPDDKALARIEALTEKMGEIEKERDNEKANSLKLKADNALEKELGKYELIDREIIGNTIRTSIVFDEGVPKFSDNGVYVDISEGVKSFIDNRPHLVKSKGSGGGSGSGEGGSSGGAVKGNLGGTRSEREAEIKARFNLKE